MGLYDRDYARGNSFAYENASRSDSQIISFVKNGGSIIMTSHNNWQFDDIDWSEFVL